MAKKDMMTILRKLLKTEVDLDFLIQLDEKDLRTLISIIRERIDKEKR
jgi:hypothetical protein